MSTKRKDFLTLIYHELKTPIATLNAYVEVLASGIAKDEATRQRYQQVIYDKMQQLSKQVEELFKYAQEESGRFKYNFQECYADDVFNKISASLEGQEKVVVKITNHIPKCLISVDAVRIEQVVMNIFNNAIKHSQNSDLVHLIGYRQDQEKIIEVSDQGDGVDP